MKSIPSKKRQWLSVCNGVKKGKNMPQEYDKVAHLGFIREAIKGAAERSLSCKRWSLATLPVMAVIFSSIKIPAGNNINDVIVIFAIIMLMLIVGLWYLDAYNEHERRMLERLYEHVCEDDTSVSQYEMSARDFWQEVDGDLRIMFSFRWYIVYMPLAMLVYKVSRLLKPMA